MAQNVAVGLLRPPHVFFYEVDVKKKFRSVRIRLVSFAVRWLKFWSIFRTKHGYHLVGYPYSTKAWLCAKRHFRSDFTKKLRARWDRKNPQVLRISEKWNIKTGKISSSKPKFICGNFFLEGIQKYKVLYYAK